MKKSLFASFLFLCLAGTAQKKITCKKGNIKSDATVIADYDGKGGIFKPFRLGVFAPNTKDTLFTIAEISFDPQDPLFDKFTLYTLAFANPEKTVLYIKGQPDTRLMERGIMEMLFNDTLPPLVQDGKLDAAAIKVLESKKNFPFPKYADFIKTTEDTLAIINTTAIKRDLAKPVSFTQVNNNSFKTLIISGTPSINQTLEITQDATVIGRVQKIVTSGEYGKSLYVFWKYIGPHVVNGIPLNWSPVAICEASPGYFGAATPVVPVIGKKSFGVTPGAYQAMESTICSSLIAKGIL
jgi:hypothetical protein